MACKKHQNGSHHKDLIMNEAIMRDNCFFSETREAAAVLWRPCVAQEDGGTGGGRGGSDVGACAALPPSTTPIAQD